MPNRTILALAALTAWTACADKEPTDESTAPLTTGVATGGPGPGETDETGDTGEPTSTTAGTTTTTTTTTSEATTAGTTLPEPTTDIPPETTTSGPTDATTTTTTIGDTSSGGPVDLCGGDAPKILFSTTLGDMVVQLDAVNAPNTTANFISYVEEGFFDGTIFHRVIDGFVLQGGGYTPDLQPKATHPPIALEISALTHVDGAISMARTNDPNSATSQFFICDGPQDLLDGEYAVFGVLIEGFDVLAAISAVPTGNEGMFSDVPIEDVIVDVAKCVP